MGVDAPHEDHRPQAPAQSEEDPLLSAPPTLAPLVGTWATSGEVLDADGEVVAELRGTDVYRWLGPTVVHEVDVEVSGRRTRSLEVVEPYDARRGAFPTRAYDDRGRIDVATATVDAEGTWTFRSPGARATLRVAEDGASMSALWVRERETGDEPWMRLSWRRTG